MSSIVNYTYDKQGISKIKEWVFGTNWPIVYIIYNDSRAYVGETLDAVRRTEQHLQETEFMEFTSICLISDKTFNKSVILDLESYLIKYMSADGAKKLINGNAGIVDHNYFYKEAYEDDFYEIWCELREKGIVSKTIIDIENSELFKYSPYKALSKEQKTAAYSILKSIYSINNNSNQSLISVSGGAGTGKTVLAVFLVKLLADIAMGKEVWKAVEDTEDSTSIKRISENLRAIKKIGFVVPMKELRNTIKAIFKTIDGLDESMVLSPKEVTKKKYDVLIVDEAHRLYRRKNLPGSNTTPEFDRINEIQMGKAGKTITRTENDFTQLDWIIINSDVQVLFYDEHQHIRVPDIGSERYEAIINPCLYKRIELFSQMRCKGGNGYYEYVKKVLETTSLNFHEYKKISGYELKVFEEISDLFKTIQEKNSSDNLCRVVAGPGWAMKQDITIDGKTFRWADDREEDTTNIIYSIHKIQGFDLNYAGVIFGREIYYDEKLQCLMVNKKELKDNNTKSAGDENMRKFVLNIYLTLMTRGINGTYIYAVDKRLRDYLRLFLE